MSPSQQTTKEIEFLLSSIEKNPDDPTLHFDLAQIYFELEAFTTALSHYEQSSLLHPSQETLVNLALTLLALGEKKKAVETAKRVIAQDMKGVVVDVLINLAYIFYHDENYEKMAELALEGIARGKRHVLLHYYAGIAFYHINQYEKAEEYLKNALKIKKAYSPAFYDLACVYTKRGEKEEAMDYLRKAIVIDGSLKEQAEKDEDLAPLHEEERFKEIINDPTIG
ncbi:MAG: tetratricopeptide repeat protein [Candidatus Kariarchaeaceae archaeon]